MNKTILIVAVIMVALALLAARFSPRVALAVLALEILVAFAYCAWVVFRPIGDNVAYRLKPPDERDLIDFDAELKSRTRN